MIDTHCHLTYPGIAERVGDVVADARAAGVDRMVSIGTGPADSVAAIQVARRFPGVVFATAGIHPLHAGEVGDVAAATAELRLLSVAEEVVALGEMGLDAHHDRPPMAVQRAAFAAQLTLAEETALPVVIHSREAIPETIEMIRATGLPADRFLFHCFSGTVRDLDAILAFGAGIGFTGIVTFPGAAAVAEASDRVPLDRLFLETDSPYLTPAPHRKVRINEPKYVPRVAALLAGRRGLAVEALAAACDRNASRFYGLPEPA
ncbi:TatD family hydrolase [Phycisphaera mikurensis]|uniref:Putative deoxyribonuclease n=1 Tax=Phycisphaera mikurensis (strain NBRC 102666 / KCTC 22515 / FYK2301M01) TaxID=1142394 RepID=I0IDA9_PHYMF|nr:TatD family hydrolase [Phycisphaera mikurensis]MBB6442372.1 TatD DNase family protein [Phycisphaera mikurensis]BAM03247.1 putative deoxyribonuclease [Phycisphaera mikurensis NBRC 102666]